MPTENELLKIANSSGFPLQIAVEHLVRDDPEKFWRIRHTEHAWKNRDGDDEGGFIDLAIEDTHGSCVLVIECKRVQDSSWVFLRPEGEYPHRTSCMSWVTRYVNGQFKYFGWHDVPVNPPTAEAVFCAVRGQDTRGSRLMLERDAGKLINATESLALEERDFRPRIGESVRFYFNVLVTTATLHLCEFAPRQIVAADGTLPDAKFTEVSCLRFRKQLSVRTQPLTFQDFERPRPLSGNEHTVFVVNILGLEYFLKRFELPNATSLKYA